MASRQIHDQSLHDRVIEIAANNLINSGQYNVYTNPGSTKRTPIGNLYPDIILTPRNSNTIQFIIEVETSSTINYIEVNQWKQYSTLGGTFYLLVPFNDKSKAQNLCRTYNIYSVKFATYWVDANNVLQINYE